MPQPKKRFLDANFHLQNQILKSGFLYFQLSMFQVKYTNGFAYITYCVFSFHSLLLFFCDTNADTTSFLHFYTSLKSLQQPTYHKSSKQVNTFHSAASRAFVFRRN